MLEVVRSIGGRINERGTAMERELGKAAREARGVEDSRGPILLLPHLFDGVRGEHGANRNSDVPDNSASSPRQLSNSGRSAWPWHSAGLTHGCGLVATRASCFKETVVGALNGKGISQHRDHRLMQLNPLTCIQPLREASAQSTKTALLRARCAEQIPGRAPKAKKSLKGDIHSSSRGS